MKKIVDERQEKELLVIEHYGFWAMYWILFATIMYKSLFAEQRGIGGEWIAFMVGCLVVLFGCTKKGLWDYYCEPNPKSYAIYSVLFSLLFSVIALVKAFVVYPPLKDDLLKAFLIFLITFAGFFVFIFSVLFIAGYIVKNVRKKLERNLDKED